MNELTGLQIALCIFVYGLGCGVSWGVSCYVFHTYIQKNWKEYDWSDYTAMSFIFMWLSWFSAIVGLSGIVARYLAQHRYNTSIRKRLLRLLRIHFSMVLDTIFVLGLATLVVITYIVSN